MRVLAGDIGGTHARLALVDVDGKGAAVARERTVPSAAAPDLATIVLAFLAEAGAVPGRACFGIAGPVVDGECIAPNIPWPVNAARLAAAIGIPHATLVNDFVAAAHAVPFLQPADLVTLVEGQPVQHGSFALIGAGTGLGEGFLSWDGTGYRVHASEGGHADFAAHTDIEWALRNALVDEFGHASTERILSGPGLGRIYRHLVATSFARARAAVGAEMEQDDPAAVVTRHGLAGDDPLCVKALDLFVSAFGAAAGNLALTVLATGGVYLAGGIAPRIVAKLKDGTFAAAFRAKGRLSALAERIPAHVIVTPDLGLLGAARVAAA